MDNDNLLPGESRSKGIVYLLVIGLFSYVFLFYNLGAYSLKEPDEGRYAEIAREMVEQGDYLVPHLNYVRYFEKPPLLYWVTAASYHPLGIHEWSFRFPNALAALFSIVITFLFASRWFGRKTGFIASAVLMTSFGFFAMSHIVTTDMLFTAMLTAALFCFCEFYRSERRCFLNLFFAALALSTLAKGPVAIILITPAILIFLFLEKRLSLLKKIVRPSGILLFVVLAAPWFIWMCVREREFFQFFFVDQHILRFLTTKHNRSEPVYYFIPVLLAGLFPWSIFIPRAVASSWRAKEMKFLVIWSLVVFVFFSFSGSKLSPYILPVFPALSVVLGGFFKSKWDQKASGKGERLIYLVLFGCLASAGFIYGATDWLGASVGSLSDLASLRIDIRVLCLGLAVVSFAIFIALAFGLMRTLRFYFIALSVFSFSVAFGIMLHAPVIDRLGTTKALAQKINEIKRDDRMVFNLNSFDETLPFYLRQRTVLVEHTGELEMGAKYPDASSYFVDYNHFLGLFESDTPAFVVFKEKRLSHVRRLSADKMTLLGCQDKRCLAANSKAIELLNRK